MTKLDDLQSIPSASLRYRPDIDGLRAVAVLPVLVAHSDLKFMPGGFLGVDVFFVISGFLITSILAKDIRNNSFSILSFYERRARRILPALFITILTSIVIFSFLMMTADFKKFGQSIVAVSVFLSNIYFAMGDGYFDSSSIYKPLLHTWSLGVEEQYYIFFPILLIILMKYSNKSVIGSLVSISAISIALAEYGSIHYKDINFFIIPGRAWELLLGGALALSKESLKKYVTLNIIFSNFAGIFGAILILSSYILLDGDTPSPSLATLLPVLGALVIIMSSVPGTVIYEILSHKVPTTIGAISYSAYLFHQPIYVCSRLIFVEIPTFGWVAIICSTLFLAWVSWRHVENPFRDRKLVGWRIVLLSSAAGTVLLILIGLGIQITGGVPQRLSVTSRLIDQGQNSISPYRDSCGNFLPSRFDDFCIFGDRNSPRVAILGDSHGKELFWRVTTQLAERPYAVQPFLWNACIPFASMWTKSHDGCNEFHQQARNFILRNPHIDIVVIAANWQAYFDCRVKCPSPTRIADADDGFQLDAASAAMGREIDDYLAAGKSVILVGQVPRMPWDVPRHMMTLHLRGLPMGDLGLPRTLYQSETAAVRPFLEEQARKNGVAIVEPAQILCSPAPDGICRAAQNGTPLYFDTHHLNGIGADRLAALLLAKIDEDFAARHGGPK